MLCVCFGVDWTSSDLIFGVGVWDSLWREWTRFMAGVADDDRAEARGLAGLSMLKIEDR
jgi:hypothetical protein